MSSKFDRLIKIEVIAKASQPELLEGLDAWLRLGLINDAQVRELILEYLSCPLPSPVVATTVPAPQVAVASSSSLPQESQDFLEVAPSESSQSPNLRAPIWQPLVAELSVRWLLFLGVFMVVVSSGVLAASQWDKFPAVGQYGVLFAYTLIFWGVSFWTSLFNGLRLTAQTLQIVTLMLVPVNFWAMDSFGLWHYPVQQMAVAIASVTLTLITFLVYKNRLRASPRQLRQLEWLPILNILGLSYLHWGWKLSGFPLIVVYVGMVGTSAIAFYPSRHRTSASRLLVIYALVVLLIRAIFVVNVPVTQLGLAIGICGWIVAWLEQHPGRSGDQEDTNSELKSPLLPWEIIGGGLLGFGWLVSVEIAVPWQATAVSVLGLCFFMSRLQRFWLRVDLAIFLGIGLQTIWLIWRLVPQSTQAWAIATATQLTGSENFPWALLSVVLFPYVIFIVGITDWLYRRTKSDLADFGELLALCFGVILTALGLTNPTLRLLNLLFSTVTLAIVTQRRSPTRVVLVYLTHIMGLLTLVSAIDRLLPNLTLEIWARILLAVMVAEWAFSLGANLPLWRRSAWHMGLVLAGLSYQFMCFNASLFGFGNVVDYREWDLLWLVTPLALTVVANRTSPPRRTTSSWLSVIALVMAQVLTLTLPGTRLIGLGVATGLMLVNTRYLQHLIAAAITVGFGLSFIGVLLWDGVPGVPRLSTPGWFLVGAIALNSLWLARIWLKRRHGTLAALYAQASDGWAIALTGSELLNLSFHAILVYFRYSSPGFLYLISAGLTSAAIVYRNWGRHTILTAYSFRWGLQLTIFEVVRLSGGSTLNMSVVNIVLALVTLLIGEWWRRRRQRAHPEAGVATMPKALMRRLPLVHTVLGTVFRLGYFNSWTGLLSLGAAITGLGVARRPPEWKRLAYISLAGISLGVYELVIYQMILHAKESSLATGCTILAIVAAAIACAYNLFAFRIAPFLRLSIEEIKATAHIHWALGSSLMLVGAGITLDAIKAQDAIPKLTGVAIILSLFLAAYALAQGRQHPNPKAANGWVYLGVAEVVGVVIYARLIWTDLSVLDPWIGAIACLIAYVLSILPWRNWGWSAIAWQQASGVIPAIAVLATRDVIPPENLLIVAGFYIWFADRLNNVRSTYISVALLDWAIARWFWDWELTDLLWYSTPIGLSLIYIAQFDPALSLPEQKQNRHNLRLLGISAICEIAFLFHQDTGIVPGIVSIIAIFAGLALRVRAFLYVGTATFLLTGFYQLVILILQRPFFKWVVGLLVGINFIWIAASFETRREQVASLVRHWLAELQEWE
ncbi:MAG: hypothetical protein KME08_03815 [Aphanothece sp. CMT-3BRIN-NPC111]|jgi:hypothetical protein|nr:hypothetical protein [Aphanothece sp. CMT-3BRIN-NPC111]